MPFIQLRTNKELSKTQMDEFKTQLGKAVCLIPGKEEKRLMVEIEGGKTMYFGGKDDEDLAMVTVDCFKQAEFEDNEKFVKAVYAALEKTLGIKEDNAYVRLLELPTWGAKGIFKK